MRTDTLIAIWIFASLGSIALGAAGLCLYEAYAFKHNKKRLTWMVRGVEVSHPHVILLLCVLAALLLGHFLRY